ncbi:uncharacterized protein LOC108743309 isoform X2 [Agrilus planipennis]|uniref:Uncharacterized protein LOC108743309 isoform X2 n=1 Tax=Agrilus planipennis TaxID=224129 RepID=A0A1W4XEB5_AGRPL|nr:uncharacterized protein LOC108743309 isoform X2 [Agrilus planipennis]
MSMLIEENEVVKLHDWNIKPKATPKFSSPIIERLKKEVSLIYGPSEITWTLTDIAKASYLLSIPPKQTQFDDDQEMRRVYTLIYDVYRHKNVLITALDSCSFFEEYSVLKDVRPKVWMLLFDLYHRNFKHRDLRQRESAKKIFSECNILEIEESLWAQRIHLAASVARMRIKNNALRLSDLLPKHLRDDRIQYNQFTPVTCWVNVNKIKNVDEITNQLKSTLNVNPLEDEKSDLEPDKFKWDKVCPHFIILHSSVRTKLSQCPLVQKHKLILQDRSFCLGPAAFGKVVTELQLKGTVIQSHIHSPRATAYLANLLSQNGKISKLVVFSAGNRKPEYEDYLSKLGTKNVSVYSEKLFECGSEESCLEEATAVFATPPNSYSAVSDPIDLVCSRGGDLNLLEVLTETEITQEGKKRIKSILDEQKKTLQFAMTKPQIQVVMYETHSEIDAENNQMVDKTLEYINKVTQLKHAVIQGKLSRSDLPHDAFTFKKKVISTEEINKYMDHDKLVRKYFEIESVSSISLLSDDSQQSLNSIITESTLNDIEVPPCDLFEKPKLKEVSPKLSSFENLKKQGCYLALIQRKRITHLDNKYMIDVAESRGLFGKDAESAEKQKKMENPKKKRKTSPRPSKTFKRNQPIEISKIAAPTLAFQRHSTEATNVPCPREQQRRMLTYSKNRHRSLTKISSVAPKPERIPLPIAVTVVQFPFIITSMRGRS